MTAQQIHIRNEKAAIIKYLLSLKETVKDKTKEEN